MTDLRQAAQQALEALESGLAFDAHSAVLQNLRTALEQPEQQAEPVAIVVSSGPAANLPMLQWVSAEHSLSTPIGTKLYTPPAAQRTPLTDAVINNAIEAAHGIKERNT
ncbi:MAG: hypothetical protein RL032_1113 [Pseudomonadota bacterium]|jgi:hypothetical protein